MIESTQTMWGKILCFLLLFLIIPVAATPSKPQTTSSSPLYFDAPISTTISSGDSQEYFFSLTQYQNVSISIQTTGNLTVYIPFVKSSYLLQNYYTNNSDFSLDVYLATNTYYFTIHSEPRVSRSYTLTLSHATPVADYHNHDPSNAYQLTENQVASHVLNYTSQFQDNWYNFTIYQNSTIRMNLSYDFNYPMLFFTFWGPYPQDSAFFNVLNITESLVLDLTPGNYSMQVSIPDVTPYLWPYHIWFTSQYELQAPEDVKIGDQLFGIVGHFGADQYVLTVDTDSVMYLFGNMIEATIWLITPETITVITPYQTPYPDDIGYMVHLTPGNYNISIGGINFLQDYVLNIMKVQPDKLEQSNNSKDNPLLLESGAYNSGFTMHVPTDVDWFAIQVTMEGFVDIIWDGDVSIIIHNGTSSSQLTNNGLSTGFFSHPGYYILQVYTSAIAVPNYSITFDEHGFGTTSVDQGQNSESSSSSRLKVGYSFGSMLLFFGIPCVVLIQLRKHHK